MASKAPATKVNDLTPKSEKVKGGLIAANDNVTLVRGAKPAPKTKDLPAKPSSVKGGRTGWSNNDNMKSVPFLLNAPRLAAQLVGGSPSSAVAMGFCAMK